MFSVVFPYYQSEEWKQLYPPIGNRTHNRRAVTRRYTPNDLNKKNIKNILININYNYFYANLPI